MFSKKLFIELKKDATYLQGILRGVVLLLFLISGKLFSQTPATLPISTGAMSKSALPQGFSQSNLGTDYSTNPCSTSLKFDTTGDYLLLYFTGVATSLSYKMKANTQSNTNDWTGIFTVEESVDGNSWTVLRTINSNTTSITTSNAGTVFTDTPLSTSRYFRWTFTNKDDGKNLAFCDVNVSTTSSGCTNTSQFPSTSINAPTGTTALTISTSQYQSSYNRVIVSTPSTFVSTYSGGGYITVRSSTYNGTIVSQGNSPLTWTATATGNYFIHYTKNSLCETATVANTSSIQCASCTSTPPANDECVNATNLTCGTLNLAGTTVGTIAENAPGGSTYASRYGVWYTFLGNGQSTTISSTGTNGFDQGMTILSGSCASFSLITSLDDGVSNGTETYTFTTTLNTRYYIYIGHWDSTSTTTGTFTISRTGATPATPSTITGASTVCANATGISYSVTNVSGMTYNWTLPSGWTQTSGGTTNAIVVTAGNTGGTISVTASNDCGTSTSQTKSISIFTALTAGAHNTTALTKCVGYNPSVLTFTTSPSGGNGSYTYQWQLNSNNITSATSNSYDPDALLTAGVYSYRCKITDGCGNTVYTNPKVITIVADPNEPTCQKSPNLAAVCIGTTLTIANSSCTYGTERGESCPLEYSSSSDGINWSTPSTTVPVLTASGTINYIRVRVSNCSSCNATPWKTYSWNINAIPLTTTINHN